MVVGVLRDVYRRRLHDQGSHGSDVLNERTPESQDLIPILISDDLTELEVVRGLLTSAGIETVASGLEQAKMLGTHLLSGLFGKRLMGARLLVQQQDFEEATALLASVKLDQLAPTDDDPSRSSE